MALEKFSTARDSQMTKGQCALPGPSVAGAETKIEGASVVCAIQEEGRWVAGSRAHERPRSLNEVSWGTG